MRLSMIIALVVGTAGGLGAQTVETPIAFDSARRVLAISAPLATRLGLGAPVWPVSGDFRDVRLYSVQPGDGFVLVAQRAGGVLERFALTPSQRAVLQAAVDSAMVVAGRPSTELTPDVGLEPAGSSFARRQLALSALVYGPLAASLASDGSGAAALYLLMSGGTFFASYGVAQSERISRAQSTVAADVGLAGGAAGWLVGYSVSGNSDRPVRAAALGGALAGTVAGFTLGRNLTDAEAHAAWGGIETAAATTWSAMTIAGVPSRGVALGVAASEPLGYAVGVLYPRRASYTVTAGDVDVAQTAGLIGGMFGGAFIGERHHASSRTIALAVGPSYLAGLAIGDAAISRKLDLRPSDATIANLGAVAGGLVGLALPVLAGSNDAAFLLGSSAAGAALGMSLVIGMTDPPRDRGRDDRTASRGEGRGVHLSVGGAGMVGVLTRHPGQYSLLRLTF